MEEQRENAERVVVGDVSLNGYWREGSCLDRDTYTAVTARYFGAVLQMGIFFEIVLWSCIDMRGGVISEQNKNS